MVVCDVWALQVSQSVDALVTLQKLLAKATAGADMVHSGQLAKQTPRYRSAGQIDVARGDKVTMVIRKHNALAKRLLDRQNDYLRFTRNWRIPAKNTTQSATST